MAHGKNLLEGTARALTMWLLVALVPGFVRANILAVLDGTPAVRCASRGVVCNSALQITALDLRGKALRDVPQQVFSFSRFVHPFGFVYLLLQSQFVPGYLKRY